MKIFAQQCKKCDESITGQLDNERPEFLVKWLHKWIAHKFYGFPKSTSNYRGRKTNAPHLESRCEACAAGWCCYRKVKQM